MQALEIIVKKRDGKELTSKEIEFLIQKYVQNQVPDYQMASFLMAVFFQGMSEAELACYVQALIDSGKNYHWDHLSAPTVDKHSTGGVGDKSSLIIAPILASYEVYVPMMSGRSLGYTGGTLDKLDAIQGYRTSLTEEQFEQILTQSYYAMTGQTDEHAPADKKLYALRDATGTVECYWHIVASILSKKFVGGARSLVFDVKWGSGAFMKNYDQAKTLAELLTKGAKSLGIKTVALLTNMNTPLGQWVGNFFEVRESIELLENQHEWINQDLWDLSMNLAAWMLIVSGKAANLEHGLEKAEQAIKNGQALKRFYQNVELQGGDVDLLKKQKDKRKAPVQQVIYAEKQGYVEQINAEKIGHAGLYLGVGRFNKQSLIKPDTGFCFHSKPGQAVNKGDPIMSIYAENDQDMEKALQVIKGAVSIVDQPIKAQTLIGEVII